jgi:hypothetical protein
MKFSNGSAIVSLSVMPLHYDVLNECSFLADLRYTFAVARRSPTRNTEPLEEEEEEDDEEGEEKE